MDSNRSGYLNRYLIYLLLIYIPFYIFTFQYSVYYKRTGVIHNRFFEIAIVPVVNRPSSPKKKPTHEPQAGHSW